MRQHHYRIIKAALIALAAGALVAVANPAKPINRDVTIAMQNVSALAASTAQVAGLALTPAIHT